MWLSYINGLASPEDPFGGGKSTDCSGREPFSVSDQTARFMSTLG